MRLKKCKHEFTSIGGTMNRHFFWCGLCGTLKIEESPTMRVDARVFRYYPKSRQVRK